MKPKPSIRSVSSAIIAACSVARAAEQSAANATMQPPPVAPGLLNGWLREQSPAFSPWDFGGQFRARYEVKENGGSSGNGSRNFDFRRARVRNHNSFPPFAHT